MELAKPADQPTIDAQTVSNKTEQDFFTLVTEYRLEFLSLRTLVRRDFELLTIGASSINKTLAKRDASAKEQRTPKVSQPAGFEPNSTPKPKRLYWYVECEVGASKVAGVPRGVGSPGHGKGTTTMSGRASRSPSIRSTRCRG